jgi:hypothetical protein
MSIIIGNVENISSQALKQLEDGLRVLVKIIVKAYKDETQTIGGSPSPINVKLAVPELLSTANGVGGPFGFDMERR